MQRQAATVAARSLVRASRVAQLPQAEALQAWDALQAKRAAAHSLRSPQPPLLRDAFMVRSKPRAMRSKAVGAAASASYPLFGTLCLVGLEGVSALAILGAAAASLYVVNDSDVRLIVEAALAT